jgi:formylglycine-generating enzyme required for sulfatase activity/tRNA A-37 threonylcarbamoyl transferase component Bud32
VSLTYPAGHILLNKYRVEAYIDQGAFGQVYRAMHLELQVPRALKVLHKAMPGVGSSDYQRTIQRFRMEAQLGASLHSEFLVQVYDFEQIEDTLILVSEYCVGGNLNVRLAEYSRGKQHIPLMEALQIACDVARGLAALHVMDVIHRDLKPSNILFGANGHAKVADLGLAQVPGGPSMRSRLSQPGLHPGTPAYMSPEQESGLHHLRPTSDIYALGIVLFEMLVGRNYNNLKPGTRLSEQRPDTPEWLDDLLIRMLNPAHQERPWDGSAVAQELQSGYDKLKKAAEVERRQQIVQVKEEIGNALGREDWPRAEAAIRILNELDEMLAAEYRQTLEDLQAKALERSEQHTAEARRKQLEGLRGRFKKAFLKGEWGTAESLVAQAEVLDLQVSQEMQRQVGNARAKEQARAEQAAVTRAAELRKLVDTVQVAITGEDWKQAGHLIGQLEGLNPHAGAEAGRLKQVLDQAKQAAIERGRQAAAERREVAGQLYAEAKLSLEADNLTQAEGKLKMLDGLGVEGQDFAHDLKRKLAARRWAERWAKTRRQVKPLAGPLIVLIVIAGIIGMGSILGGAPSNDLVITLTASSTEQLGLAVDMARTPTKTNLPMLTTIITNIPSSTETTTANAINTLLPSIITWGPANMQWAYIPARSFLMGSDPDKSLEECQKSINHCQRSWFEVEAPIHEVFLSPYYLNTHEVTHQEYATFLNFLGNKVEDVAKWLNIDSPYFHLEQEGREWHPINGYDDHPIAGVDWLGAKAYCEWAGGRLPTEAEWENAARGGLEGKRYPWGDEAPVCTPGMLNGAQFCTDSIKVGSYQPNGYGLYDMAGNVSEWVEDWYDSSFYAQSPIQNPSGPESGNQRVFRGGSWGMDPFNLNVARRQSSSLSRIDTGFRCALPADNVNLTEVVETTIIGSASTQEPGEISIQSPEPSIVQTSSPEPISTRVSANIQWAYIPAGSFLMGDDPDKVLAECAKYQTGCTRNLFEDLAPKHEVLLDDYYMNVYEVTNMEYAVFLNEMGNQSEGGKSWINVGSEYTWIEQVGEEWKPKSGYEDHPVVTVAWYGARAYCDWVGGRLPTEAEWEKAARGGLDEKTYSWGDIAPNCTPGVVNGAQYTSCDGRTVPVGSFQPNGYGLYDMAGNVWEWVSDWYSRDYYANSPLENPLGPNTGVNRVLRGGSWNNVPYKLRVAYRLWINPDTSYIYSYSSFGFRCARSP